MLYRFLADFFSSFNSFPTFGRFSVALDFDCFRAFFQLLIDVRSISIVFRFFRVVVDFRSMDFLAGLTVRFYFIAFDLVTIFFDCILIFL